MSSCVGAAAEEGKGAGQGGGKAALGSPPLRSMAHSRQPPKPTALQAVARAWRCRLGASVCAPAGRAGRGRRRGDEHHHAGGRLQVRPLRQQQWCVGGMRLVIPSSSYRVGIESICSCPASPAARCWCWTRAAGPRSRAAWCPTGCRRASTPRGCPLEPGRVVAVQRRVLEPMHRPSCSSHLLVSSF